MLRAGLAAAIVAAAMALAGCGSADAGGAGPDTPTTGMCAPDVPDCDDMAAEDIDIAGARAEAAELLGLAEGELPADVRVGRRGDEHMMLTEDYVLGRHTVELDADAAGVYRVTAVVTELPEGPETTTSE